MWKVWVVFILCTVTVSASCPKDCQCPPDTPTCVSGVGLMPDACGCCKVCARQLFEDCSRTQPCDHTKGLECNFGGGYDSAKGICRAKSDGRTCEYNNKIYQNGEIFRPNCKHQCTCMDGAVGCVSLCPRELTLSKQACAKPRRVKVPGQCCEQLICPEDKKTDSSVGKKHRKKHSKDTKSEDELTNENELAAVWRGESKSLPAFQSHHTSRTIPRGVNCVSHTTAWSPCSKSCGTGLSTRVTNVNTQCKVVTETRICEVRPCSFMNFNTLKRGQNCSHTETSRRPVRLSFASCHSLKKFLPRYCSSCSDGRCCRPHLTQTSPVHFRCKNGVTVTRMVMMIESCKCDRNCFGSNKKKSHRKRLLNDVYKLKI